MPAGPPDPRPAGAGGAGAAAPHIKEPGTPPAGPPRPEAAAESVLNARSAGADNSGVMSAGFVVPVTPAGMLAAAACVVAGGPLFASGLRALRQRRLLAGLSPALAGPGTNGLVQLVGTVALESPLFSPLSQRPCAGYELVVRATDTNMSGRVGQRRGFRLVSGECDAFVEDSRGAWVLPVTAERAVAAGEQISANMAALLDQDETLRWLRVRRAPLHIVERSLAAGARVEVIGVARSNAPALPYVARLEATGTDGAAFADPPEPADRPRLHVTGHEALDLHVVADGSASALRFAPSGWRMIGAALGPLLSLTGLLYLAHAAETTIAGRF